MFLVLATGVFSPKPLVAGAAGWLRSDPQTESFLESSGDCPSRSELDRLVSAASDLMQQGQFDAAVKVLQPEPLPKCDARAALLLGAAFEGSGHGSDAQRILEQAHRQWPSDPRRAAALARSYWISGRAAQAAEALGSTRITPSTPVQELELRAEVYLAVHQLLLAQTAAEAAFRSHPSTETLLLLANTIQTQGRAQDALTLLATRREENAASVPFLITIAETEFDSGIYAAAHDDLAHATAIDPGSYQAHYLLGNTLVQQRQIDAAMAEYQTAIGIAPEKPRTYYQLALAKVIQGDVDGAKQSLVKALVADEQYAPAYTELGDLLMQQGRFAEAVEPLRKAIQYGPTQESPYYLLTRVYARLGQKRQSDEMLQRYQEVKATNHKRPARAEPDKARPGDQNPLPASPRNPEP